MMTKTSTALFLCLFISIVTLAQVKGIVTNETSATFDDEGNSYGLVIGISSYQNESITPLQFADRDALAFYEYLKQTGIPEDNLLLLLNEKATHGSFWASVGYFSEVCKPGDKLYIYFSGHGDVENRTIVKDAFLLPYDSPSNMYAAGAIGILYLKSWLATLSSKGIQIIFIADACRAGNLAGGREGIEATADVLKEAWVNEIKMLSCQPGEMALEGKQWGGGRGVFSYELINGLNGQADKDKDGFITLRELNIHMISMVPDETYPMPQNPLITGKMDSRIGRVMPVVSNSLAFNESSSGFSSLQSKGLEESLLANADDSVKYNYKLFQLCLDSGIVLKKPPKPSAYSYAQKIPDDERHHLIASLVRRNLCAAMFDDAQICKNALMNGTMMEHTKGEVRRWSYECTLLRSYLGDERLRQMGQLNNFIATEMIRSVFGGEDIEPQRAVEVMDSIIATDSLFAYGYLVRAFITGRNVEGLEAAEKDAIRVLHICPDNVFAAEMVTEQMIRRGEIEGAIDMKKNLSYMKENMLDVNLNIAQLYATLGQQDSAMAYFNKYVAGQLKETPSLAARSNSLDDDVRAAVVGKIKSADEMNNLASSALLLKLYPFAYDAYSILAMKDKKQGANAYYNMACIKVFSEDYDTAVNLLEQAINAGWTDMEYLIIDKDLEPLHKNDKFNALISIHKK